MQLMIYFDVRMLPDDTNSDDVTCDLEIACVAMMMLLVKTSLARR
jgi:hypothetical protein